MQLAVQLMMKAADSFVPRLPSFASTLHNRWGSTRSPQDSRRPPRDADPDGRNHTMPRPRSPQSPQLRHNHSRGSYIVEFALILPLVLLLTVAVIDFGRAFFVRNIVEQAAREGARLRAVSSLSDSAKVTARVNQVIGSAGVGVKTLTVTGPDASRLDHVVVVVNFNWIFPGVFNLFGAGFRNPSTLSGEAWMRNEGTS